MPAQSFDLVTGHVAMDPALYDAWYDTPRGRRISETGLDIDRAWMDYARARWHDTGKERGMFAALPMRNLQLHSAFFLPGAGPAARWLKTRLPAALPLGALLLASGGKT